MSKKISIGITIMLIAIACTITFVLTSSFSLETYNNSVQDVKQREEIYKKLSTIDSFVRENYIDDVDQDNIMNAISEGYMNVMNDKYARYLSSEEYQQEKQQNDGFVVGIGITAKQDESGYICIDSIMTNSPAQEMGLEEGELIVAVNDTQVISAGYKDSVKAIAGDVDTSVKLTIRSEGVDRDVVLTRKEIEIKSVLSKMIDDIGYIQITEFNSKTTAQFNNAIQSLTKDGAKGIVFDVRNNGGGLLTPTLDILDELLPKGTIATATYKDNKTEVLGTSDSNEIDLPMVVLVNSRTASAAELFSSALRDYNKAQLVGTNTYGKGVMQQTYELQDGSSIAFTTATFQTTVTPNFDGVGLKPNYEVALENDTVSDLRNLDETTDPQLKKALEIVLSSIN